MPLLALASRLYSIRVANIGHVVRTFSIGPSCWSKAYRPRTPLVEADMIENFLKGSGPGGQKINKTASAVQLKHIPTGIVVKYQDTRSREINRKMARRILQDKIEELELGDEARTKVKAREKSKKKASSTKKSRRKYRALASKDQAVDEIEEASESGMHSGEETVYPQAEARYNNESKRTG